MSLLHSQPLVEWRRGEIVESLHCGALAVVDAAGRLLARQGDPQTVTFTRSSAKPLQALPFIEAGGQPAFNLPQAEVALLCASHTGTDEHLQAVQALQARTGVVEADLLCGTHPPVDAATAEALKARGEQPTPNRHNCSGKHTGMLALARLLGAPASGYLERDHPVQQAILAAVAGMCGLPPGQVIPGTDGCSAPNFAVPLETFALAFARLCDPASLPPPRAAACRTITAAMTAHPVMVAGPGRFDTRLMEAAGGRVICKGGAEGYLALGVMPGALGSDSPGIGVAIKVADGDLTGRPSPWPS
jgi:L-asparaginase II